MTDALRRSGDPTARAHHEIEVMGTVVSIDVRQIGPPAATVAAALDRVAAWLRWVDTTFSTYRTDSQVSRLADRTLGLADCDPLVGEVLDLCASAQAATDGYFSATYDGRLDPTGLVKGWATERASRLLRAAGLPDHTLGAGGDVVCAGEPEPGMSWRVGIADPHRPGRLLTVVAVRDGAVATSGTAERTSSTRAPAGRRPRWPVRASSGPTSPSPTRTRPEPWPPARPPATGWADSPATKRCS